MDTHTNTHLEFLLTTLDNLNDAILVVDQAGKVLYTNHGFDRLFKPLVGNIVEWTFDKMVAEFDAYDLNDQYLPPTKWPFAKIMKGEKVFQEKFKIILKSNNNSSVFIQISGGPVKYPGAEQTYSIISASDITAQQKSLRQLRESEQKLSLFIEHAPAALAMFDRDMRYIAASRRWLDDYRIAGTNIIGACHYEIITDISEEWKTIHRRGLKGEYIKNDDDRFVREDGSVQYVKWEMRPWFNDEHEIGGIIIMSEEITERKLNERRLIESEKRFANIFYDSPLPIAITRLSDGEIILVNPSVTKFFEYTQEELIGNTTLEMFFWEDAAQRQEFTEKIRSHKSVTDMETSTTLKSGERRHVLMWGKLIDYYGEECVLLEIIDITEKKIQEEKIRLQNEKINAILYSLPDKLFIHDLDGTFLEAYSTNPDGYIVPREYFIGKNLHDVFPDEIADLNHRYLQECLQKREPVSHEFSTDYKGTYSTFEVRIVPFLENQAIRFVRDITKTTEAEKKIFKLSKAIEESPIAIIITDTEANVSYASKAFETITGYLTDEVIGKNMRILKSGKNKKELYAKIWQTIQSGKMWEGELINRKKDGSYYWEHMSITPLYEKEHQFTGYLAIQQDITKERNREQEIRKLNSSLERRIAERTAELQENQDKLMLSQRIAQLAIW
ncbi:MAG TPA: PAS domain S-box protein, partial [Proteiniphilum sp.]|nr:PAS domain S-box protein [Proteiniphilum sp.]